VDGFRIRDAAAPQGDPTAYLGDLLIVDTDRIEVMRGTGSSLYGTGASAGIVNIVTDNGGGQFRGDILGEGGGLGLARGVARVSGGAFHDRLAYTGGIAHLNVTRGVDGNDTYRNASAQAFARYALTPSAQFSGRIFGANTYTQLNASPSALTDLPPSGDIPAVSGKTFAPDADDPDYSRSAYYVSGLLSYLQRIGSTASFRVTYQGLATSRRNDNGPAGPGFFQPAFSSYTLFDGRLDTIQARTDIQAGRWNLITAGYEFERERYHDRSTDRDPSPVTHVDAGTDIEQTSHAVFAQDQLRLMDGRLQVSLSGRAQSYGVDRPSFRGGGPIYTNPSFGTPPSAYTGDGSVAYLLPRSGTKLRAHVGNGYRAPSLYERFGSSFYFGTFSPYGDPMLRPERVISFDAGFDQYFARERARVRATYFYTRIQEAIIFDFTGGIDASTDPYGRFGGYRNTKGGLARGFEIGLDTAMTRSTNVTATYTYTKSQERESSVYGGSLRAFRVFDHMFTFRASQRFGKRVDATFDVLAASNYIFPFYVFPVGSRPFEFEGPLKGDIAINYTHPLTDRYSVRFYTRIENVFNRTYYEEGFRTPKAWAVGGMKFIF
jgi:iron complex outermembrane receptor protein